MGYTSATAYAMSGMGNSFRAAGGVQDFAAKGGAGARATAMAAGKLPVPG